MLQYEQLHTGPSHEAIIALNILNDTDIFYILILAYSTMLHFHILNNVTMIYNIILG